MSFSNLELNGAEVQKVEITATTPLVGDWYWNCNGDHVSRHLLRFQLGSRQLRRYEL